MTYQPYQSCTLCSGKAQPGTVDLMKYIMNRFPQTTSMGIYNCRNVAGSSTKSQHSCGRAWDCGIPTLSGGVANKSIGNPVVAFLAKYSTQFGIVDQIYARVIYDDASPSGRYYGGVHPHNDHIHITQRSTQAANLRYADYVRIAGPATEGEDQVFDKSTPKSSAVAMYQRDLIILGYDLGDFTPIQASLYPPGADGDFGDTAEAQTKLFQKNLGLAVTGKADAMTVATAANLARFGERGSGGTVDQTARNSAAAAAKTANTAQTSAASALKKIAAAKAAL